jgi:hypothetical protein
MSAASYIWIIWILSAGIVGLSWQLFRVSEENRQLKIYNKRLTSRLATDD